MHSFIFYLLMAAPPSGPDGAPQGGSLMTFLPIIAIFAIVYFLMIRPQNKKQKETQKMIAALKKGDKVVTIGGIHGTIQSVKEHSVIVKVDDSTKIEFNRGAIASVVSVAKDEETESSGEKA
ncbi:MAG: preprotein translocase subunit YajC [Treponema sp.]|nr:preprotein translocase subunit YajC [Treponema sp.]